jgi:hypothetical protein
MDRAQASYHQPMLRRKTPVALAAVFAATLASGRAAAQDQLGSIALNKLDPTPAGDTFFAVPSPYVLGDPVDVRATIVLDAARNPLRLLDGDNEASVVSSQTFMHIGASLGILDRAMIDVMLPVALVQRGDDPTLQGVNVSSPSSTQVGDLRIGGRIRLYGEFDEPFQLGTGAYIFTPTGADGSYVGEGSARVTPYVSLGGQFEAGVDWWWTVFAGSEIRSAGNGSGIRYGAAFAAAFVDQLLQVGPEFYASTPIQETDFRLSESQTVETTDTTHAELLFSARARVWHFVAGAAGGPGLTRAIGTPSFRLMGSIAFDPRPDDEDPSALDDDGDGIINRDDQCPDAHGEFAAGTARHGCPVLDDDEDGIPNHLDACPNTYGHPDDDPETNGCMATARARRGRRG